MPLPIVPIHVAMLPLAFLLGLVSSLPSTVTSPVPPAGPQAAVSGARPRNVALLIYEGVELLDFAGPGEVFSAVHGPEGRAFRVYTVARSKEPVRSQGFVTVTPEFSIADCPAPDLVVVPGGNVPAGDHELQEWVRRCAGSCELVMSVCNGALLVAESGLLEGLEATTHRSALAGLGARSPTIRVLTNRRFVDNGKVMTCAGVSAGIDGALHVVERLLGEPTARATAYYMEYDWRPQEIAALHAQPGVTLADGPLARLAATARDEGLETALARYRALEPRPDEDALNREGYRLLRARDATAARALFELVVAAFPASANAHDSLSEACEALGDTEAAVLHAQSALARLEAGTGGTRAKALENSAASRLARLGGDPQALRFGCPPCSGECDGARYISEGPCPGCGMSMVERGE